LLDQVVENAVDESFNQFYFQNLRNKIGMNGAWFKAEWNNLCVSTARSMARFGILIANNGEWNGQTIIQDKDYIYDMINTSQDLNRSYGYLWWLNGKESFMLPQSDMVFNWKMIPEAPDDMYAAMGKNGQMLNISPSTGLIMVRMGDAPNDENFISVIFNNEIWERINDVIDESSSVSEEKSDVNIYPNPVKDELYIDLNNVALRDQNNIQIFNILGEKLISGPIDPLDRIQVVNVEALSKGLYFIKIGENMEYKFIKD
jgi:CubicO group peptidase (beta-lactamase class C family)